MTDWPSSSTYFFPLSQVRRWWYSLEQKGSPSPLHWDTCNFEGINVSSKQICYLCHHCLSSQCSFFPPLDSTAAAPFIHYLDTSSRRQCLCSWAFGLEQCSGRASVRWGIGFVRQQFMLRQIFWWYRLSRMIRQQHWLRRIWSQYRLWWGRAGQRRMFHVCLSYVVDTTSDFLDTLVV